jgi:DNA-binding PadR family transcriptional regulator
VRPRLGSTPDKLYIPFPQAAFVNRYRLKKTLTQNHVFATIVSIKYKKINKLQKNTMTQNQVFILVLLAEHPRGLYGAEILHLGEGNLKRGSIYNFLERLEEDRLLRTEEVPQGIGEDPRIRHIITAEGKVALRDFMKTTKILSIAKTWGLI